MSDGVIHDAPESLVASLKVMLTRQLGPARKRAVKRRLARLYNTFSRISLSREQHGSPAPSGPTQPALKAGDLVRVKSREEITATLGLFKDLQGLTFMPEMWQYCGTQQRVFKPLVRFFDEREYQIRKARGIVLLDGLLCEGTAIFGPCDRSCFFFWREEWLDRIDGAPDTNVTSAQERGTR
jgi:hypothetical protein